MAMTFVNPLTGTAEDPNNRNRMGFGNVQRPGAPIIGPAQPSPLQKQYSLYDTAIKQNAQDSGWLTNAYKSIAANPGNPNATYSPGTIISPNIHPETYNYSPSGDVTSSLGILRGLAETGGYSPSDVNNIRERGISPIRSIYSSANRDIDRQRALQGGYSPNYNAVKAKMAREMSSEISNKMTDVNAQVAQMIASGKLAAAAPYASAAGGENTLRTNVGLANTAAENAAAVENARNKLAENQFNVGARNEAQKFNISLPFQTQDLALRAMDSLRGLYGTTPALTSMFGNQAIQSAGLQNNINQGNSNNDLDLLRTLLASLPQGESRLSRVYGG